MVESRQDAFWRRLQDFSGKTRGTLFYKRIMNRCIPAQSGDTAVALPQFRNHAADANSVSFRLKPLDKTRESGEGVFVRLRSRHAWEPSERMESCWALSAIFMHVVI